MHSYLTCKTVGWSPFLLKSITRSSFCSFVAVSFMWFFIILAVLHWCLCIWKSSHLFRSLKTGLIWESSSSVIWTEILYGLVVEPRWAMWESPQASQLEGSMVGYLVGSMSVPAAWFCRHVGLGSFSVDGRPSSTVRSKPWCQGLWAAGLMSESLSGPGARSFHVSLNFPSCILCQFYFAIHFILNHPFTLSANYFTTYLCTFLLAIF